MPDINLSPFTQKPKAKPVRAPQNFVEALKGIGGYTAQTVKRDLVAPTIKDIVNTFTGGPVGNQTTEMPQANEQQWSNDWLRQKEQDQAIAEEAARRQRHTEVLATPVYDRESEKIKRELEAVRQELELLVKDLETMATSTIKAVEEEIVNPGAYHISFFEKLKKFIIMLRKQVNDSANWLEMSYARKAAKNTFWGNFGKSGTKYLLSSERYMSTSAG